MTKLQNATFISDKMEITIDHLRPEHDGIYTCVAVNSQGEGICHTPYPLTVVCKLAYYISLLYHFNYN